MSEINKITKSLLFVNDRISYLCDKNNTKIFIIYQSIIKRFYNDGYRNFIILSEKGSNDIVLSSILKIKEEYPDAYFAPILNCRNNIKEPLEKIYDLNTIQEKFNENEHLLSRCNEMIYTTIEYQDNSRCTLMHEVKTNKARRILIYEVYLGNNKLRGVEEVIK